MITTPPPPAPIIAPISTGGAEGGAEGGDEEGPRDRNARTDYSKFKEEMDAAAKEAEDKAEGK